MWGVLQQVVVLGLLSGNNVIRFSPYLDHRVTESTKTRRIIFLCNISTFTYLSSSSFVSDSVGSMSMAVEMGHEQVGGWKP